MARIAHVGCGYWGSNIIRNFAELGSLAAVVDADGKAAARASAEHGVVAASFEHVLADRRIDGISIASPAELHFSQASAALRAGKHVFVEKPLALRAREGEELCALAEKNGRHLMVGHLLQYHAGFTKLRAMVASGELGRILYVYSNRLSLGKFRREENVLWSFAPHDISMILAIFGSEPSHVSAQGTISYTPGTADVVTLQMHFAGGGSGHVFVSWMNPFKEQRLVVIAEKGMAVFEDSNPDWDRKLLIYRHRIETGSAAPVPTKVGAEAIAFGVTEPLKEECRHFIQCVDQNLEPRTNAREGLRVLRVLEEAESALQGNLRHQEPAGTWRMTP